MSGSIQDTVLASLKKESVRTTWQTGDRVEVVKGSFVGMLGSLVSLDLDDWSATVQLQEDESGVLRGLDAIQTISIQSLNRRMWKGDNVVIAAGSCKGQRGMVVSVGGSNLKFIEEGSGEEVRGASSPFNAHSPPNRLRCRNFWS